MSRRRRARSISPSAHGARQLDPQVAIPQASRALRSSKTYPLAACLEVFARFRWLALRLAEKSLIIADLPATHESHIIKLSFLDRNDRDSARGRELPAAVADDAKDTEQTRDEQFRSPHASWDPFTLSILADAWPCGSFHLETQAPQGLEIVGARISEYHGYLSDADKPGKLRQGARLAPERRTGVGNRIERTHLYQGKIRGVLIGYTPRSISEWSAAGFCRSLRGLRCCWPFCL